MSSCWFMIVSITYSHQQLLNLMSCPGIGCYVTKRGIPSRSSGYIRWETQACGFAHRGNHILLVSSQFIEVRNINTGQIAQVIEDVDIRLMYSGHSTSDRDDRVLVAIGGDKKADSIAERVVELVETVEYVSHSAVSNVPDIWDEWDNYTRLNTSWRLGMDHDLGKLGYHKADYEQPPIDVVMTAHDCLCTTCV